MTTQTPIEKINWREFHNGAGEDIPPFAAMRVISTDADGIITTGKPNADSQTPLVFNGPTVCSNGGPNGVAAFGLPAFALYDTADGSPAIGDSYGTVSGSFKLKKGNTGFTVCGTTQGASGQERCEFVATGGSGGNAALVTITSATVTASRQPGTVVKGGSGSCKVQNYYASQPALTSGKTYYCVRDGEADGLPLFWCALEPCA